MYKKIAITYIGLFFSNSLLATSDELIDKNGPSQKQIVAIKDIKHKKVKFNKHGQLKKIVGNKLATLKNGDYKNLGNEISSKLSNVLRFNSDVSLKFKSVSSTLPDVSYAKYTVILKGLDIINSSIIAEIDNADNVVDLI